MGTGAPLHPLMTVSAREMTLYAVRLVSVYYTTRSRLETRHGSITLGFDTFHTMQEMLEDLEQPRALADVECILGLDSITHQFLSAERPRFARWYQRQIGPRR